MWNSRDRWLCFDGTRNVVVGNNLVRENCHSKLIVTRVIYIYREQGARLILFSLSCFFSLRNIKACFREGGRGEQAKNCPLPQKKKKKHYHSPPYVTLFRCNRLMRISITEQESTRTPTHTFHGTRYAHRSSFNRCRSLPATGSRRKHTTEDL